MVHLTVRCEAADGGGVEAGGYDCAGSASLSCPGLVGEEDRPGTARVAQHVRKILRSDETDFSYERKRQPMPRIGPWQAQLEQLLTSNEGKPSREQLTLIRIFEELRALGYEPPRVCRRPSGLS